MVGGASLLQQIRDFLADYRPQRLSHDKAIPAGVLLLSFFLFFGSAGCLCYHHFSLLSVFKLFGQ